jgi:hypothetical protein
VAKVYAIKNLFHQEWKILPRHSEAINGKIWHKHPDKWRNNSWALHHDSAPAHMSLVVWQFLASTKMMVFPQPPYTLDLVPCDFLLFLKMKLKLKRRCFDSIEEIQTKSQDVMKTLM